MAQKTNWQVQFKRFDTDSWHPAGMCGSAEAARESAENLLKDYNAHRVRVIQSEVITVDTVIFEKKESKTLYEYLVNEGIFQIELIAHYPDCQYLTRAGLERFEDCLSDHDKKYLKDGDSNYVYFIDADGGVWPICRLTERNCKLLEEKTRTTRAAFIEKMAKRIKFED